MKRAVQFASLAFLILLAGCASHNAAYQSSVRLTPQAGGQTYAVDFRIADSDGEPVVITTPRLLVFKGQEGKVRVEGDKVSVICSAVVDDTLGGPRAKITIDVEEDGETVWSETKTVVAEE